MNVVITLTFDSMSAYQNWLNSQISNAAVAYDRPRLAAKETLGEDLGTPLEDAVPDTLAEPAQREAHTPPPKKRRGRKPRAKTETAPASTTPDEVLPAAPATEVAPTEGERVYTLADSREVLTAYLAKAGNGAESLLKELKVHKAKRINEVPQEHIHGFLKRMVEES